MPQPAAGADWSVRVPGGHRWHIQTVIGTLTTSGVAANRRPKLVVTDGNVNVLVVPSGVAETASLGWINVWGDGLVSTNDGLYVSQGIPDLYLAAGATIGSLTTLIDVGDQWSGVSIFVVDEMVGGGRIDIDDTLDVEIAAVSPALLGG